MISATDKACVFRNTSRMSGYPWIVEWLKERKVSRAKFGRALGLDGPKTTRSIKGDREFTNKELADAANFFQCSIEQIITGNRISNKSITPDIQRESDIALMYVLKMIFHLLMKHQVVSSEGLDFNFSEALDHYHKKGWTHAAQLIAGFRTFVTEEPHQLEKVAIQRLLELAPLGSA